VPSIWALNTSLILLCLLLYSGNSWINYIYTNIMFLDIIRLPVLVGPDVGTSSVDWTQMSRFYLKTETESSLRNVVFCDINRTMNISRNTIVVLMYHRHKLLHLMNYIWLSSKEIRWCATQFSFMLLSTDSLISYI
jgi:hypothetical protein